MKQRMMAEGAPLAVDKLPRIADMLQRRSGLGKSAVRDLVADRPCGSETWPEIPEAGFERCVIDSAEGAAGDVGLLEERARCASACGQPSRQLNASRSVGDTHAAVPRRMPCSDPIVLIAAVSRAAMVQPYTLELGL